MDWRGDGRIFQLPKLLIEVGAKVQLVQDDDRLRPAAGCEADVALDAAYVEVAVEPANDEEIIDVRSNDLLLCCVSGGLSNDHRCSRYNGVDDRGRAVSIFKRNPIADRRKIHSRLRVVHETPADARVDFVAGGQDAIRFPELRADASVLQVRVLLQCVTNGK